MVSDSLKIAIAQVPNICDAEANGATIREAMRDAAGSGARLIHFSEGALSGYPGDQAAKDLLRGWGIGWAAVREEARSIADLAGELGLWVVLGSAHPLTSPHLPHNSLYIVSDSGEVWDRYDKRLCSHSETGQWFTPGFDAVTFEVDGFTFGCALCIEINFPEIFLDYRSHGVDCMLFSSFSKDPMFGTLAQGHAAAHNFWMSVAVPSQCSAALPSGIVGPNGQWQERCSTGMRPQVAIAELNRHDPDFDIALNRQRPWRDVSRVGQIYRELQVHDLRSVNRRDF